ncbi:MAG TPA: hypothetical protein VEQ63_14040 [Bryobacteraceae bacterium]|nr:hypothetical protein [Bryobacteraceae bacterium]
MITTDGRQVALYLTPTDIETLESAAADRLGAVLIDARCFSPHGASIRTTVRQIESGVRSLGHLVRPSDLHNVVMRHVPAQQYWVVDEQRTPVVEVDGGFFDGNILRRGRLYCVTSFYGSGGEPVAKGADVVRWAAALFRAVKKLSRYDASLNAYLGPDADAWCRQGGTLVAH